MNAFRGTLFTAAAIAAGIGLLGFIALRRAGDTVDNIGAAINPVNPRNIFASGTNAVVQAFSSVEGATLGDRLFALFNPNAPGERRFNAQDGS